MNTGKITICTLFFRPPGNTSLANVVKNAHVYLSITLAELHYIDYSKQILHKLFGASTGIFTHTTLVRLRITVQTLCEHLNNFYIHQHYTEYLLR